LFTLSIWEDGDIPTIVLTLSTLLKDDWR
jgi:hypothetical protein